MSYELFDAPSENKARYSKLAPIVGLVVLAVALRMWFFGDPIIDVDEQFYFLTGGRMLHGSLPYVDIWDRKPVGLFLIYAFGYALTSGSVIGYQLLATVSVIATALVLRTIALRIATPRAAWIGAAAYLLYLLAFNGAGGQTPIFYNLPMAVAALLLIKLAREPAKIRSRGALAMLLVGIAIQIKYTAVFEGMFFGLWLLWTDWRSGRRPHAVLLNGVMWASLALLPTALALGWYAAIGHAHEFVQANFLSVMSRHEPIGPALKRLLLTAADLSPVLLAIGLGVKPLKRSAEGRFLLGWSAAAAAAYLGFGNYYDHYALPLLLPFCATGAAGLMGPMARRYLGPAILLVSFCVGSVTAYRHWRQVGGAADVARLTGVIRPHLHGCMFVFEGHSILYDTTNACFVTRYVFPYHLSARKEADALGVNVMTELGHIRAQHPSVVMIRDRWTPQSNGQARSFVLDMLRHEYRFVAEVKAGKQKWLIYEWRDGSGSIEQRVPAR